MPAPRTIFSTRTRAKIKEMVINMAVDSSLGAITVKYRRFKEGSAFNPENQAIASVYVDYSGVSVLKGAFTDYEMEQGGGRIELGDVKFLAVQSQVTGVPRPKDVIAHISSGVSYDVKDHWEDPFGITYVFQCREM